jgi:hypothetical protein
MAAGAAPRRSARCGSLTSFTMWQPHLFHNVAASPLSLCLTRSIKRILGKLRNSKLRLAHLAAAGVTPRFGPPSGRPWLAQHGRLVGLTAPHVTVGVNAQPECGVAALLHQ